MHSSFAFVATSLLILFQMFICTSFTWPEFYDICVLTISTALISAPNLIEVRTTDSSFIVTPSCNKLNFCSCS